MESQIEQTSEDAEEHQTERSKAGCYQFFGIKSHLHHFYDYNNHTDDSSSAHFLLKPKRSKRCSPILWKVLLWFGINSLVFGAILILVSHFTPRKETLQTSSDERFALVDKNASRVNATLDILATVGVVCFCVAGILVIIAIVLPTYFSQYCFEDRDTNEETISLYSSAPSNEPRSPVERSVPATQLIRSVQPKRLSSESGVIDTRYDRIE